MTCSLMPMRAIARGYLRAARALALGLTLALVAGQQSRAAEPASPAYATPTSTIDAAIKTGRIPAGVVETASKRREVHVLVELQLSAPYSAEPLLNSSDAERQRLAIAQAQNAVMDDVAGLTPKPLKRMRYTPYVSLWGDVRTLAQLVKSKAVRRVLRDGTSTIDLASSTRRTGALAAQRGLGLLGSGQAVVIIDTGVDRSHPFFGGRVVSEACFSDDGGWFSGRTSHCPNGDEEALGAGTAAPCGTVGCDHGTHVAGIAAGAATGTTTFSGVASNADIIAIQVFHREDDQDDCGPNVAAPCILADDSDVVLALERVFELRQQFDIAAANLSLGRGRYVDRATCDNDGPAVRDAVANLFASNIATVAAAGNGAAILDANDVLTGFNVGIGMPGCISNVLSVGSVNDVDALATSSQFGALLSMLAVGIDVDSAVPGGGFAPKSGTSMATPHVTGAVAALAGLNPLLSVTTLRNRLLATGLPVADLRAAPALLRPRLQLDVAVENQEARPLPPSSLRRTTLSGSTVGLAWLDNARSETTFRLSARRASDTAIARSNTVNGANLTAGMITLLTPNVDYDVSVQACDAGNRCSLPSNVVRIQTLNTLPSTPTNARAGSITVSSIELRWDSVSSNPVTGFRIGHDVNGAWTNMIVPANTRSLNFTGLAANRRYDFWIQAINADGASPRVNLGATTLSFGAPPAPPTDLHICGVRTFESLCFANLTTLLWQDNASDETRYEFEWTRALVGVPLSQAVFSSASLAANARSYNIGLSSGGLYAFRVRACNLGGCSSYSNMVSYTAP